MKRQDFSENTHRLVVFDVEGVLVPRHWFVFNVARSISIRLLIIVALLGVFYETGILSLETVLKEIYRRLKGTNYEWFISKFRDIPLIPGVEETMEELKKGGYEIAFISAGLPRVLIEELSRRLNSDYAYGLEVGIIGGLMSGEIWGDVILPGGKAVVMKQLIQKYITDPSIDTGYYVGVADDSNNLPLFQLCNLRIGYDPDFILSFKSDYVIRGNLTAMLPIVRGEDLRKKMGGVNSSDLLRGAIHVGSFTITLLCIYISSRQIVVSFLLVVTFIYILSEFFRMQGKRIPLVTYITERASDKSKMMGFEFSPIYFAIGIILSLLVFRSEISYVALTVLTLGDGTAKLVGKEFGKTVLPINKGKTLEGMISGIIFAFLGSLLFTDPKRAIAAATAGMIAEVFPNPFNDNLLVPIFSGLILSLMMTI